MQRIPRRNRLCTKAIRGYSKRASGVHGEANPQIRKNLAEQMVSKEAIDDWCNRLKADMEHSFAVSEEFLNNFIIAKSKEFERELQTRLGKV